MDMRSILSLLLFFISINIGTSQSIELVRDVAEGAESALFFSPVYWGDKVAYGNFEPEFGIELWQTDGTEDGTVLLNDLNPAVNVFGFCFPEPLFGMGDKLFFCGNDGQAVGLYVADANTGEMESIEPNGLTLSPNYFYEFGDQVVFAAYTAESGVEYWITDGSEDNTFMLADIAAGAASSAPSFFSYVDYHSFNDLLLFKADDGVHGREYWVTDGTVAGTQLLKDINNGTSSTGFGEKVVSNGSFAFFNAQTSFDGYSLFVTDGSTDGTQLLKDVAGLDALDDSFIIDEMDGFVYFVASDADGRFIWKSDGTAIGTGKVFDFEIVSDESIYEKSIGRTDSHFYFMQYWNDACNVWASDGTSQGTNLVLSTPGGLNTVSYSPVCDLDGKYLFRGFDLMAESTLYVSEGTAATTSKLADVQVFFLGAFAQNQHVDYEYKIIDDILYFGGITDAFGHELWQTDGTVGGTFMIDDFVEGPAGLSPASIIRLDDRLLFEGITDETGYELFRFIPEPTTSSKAISSRAINLSVFPNPSSGSFQLALSENVDAADLSIYDTQGRLVYKDAFVQFNSIDLDLNVAPGLYIAMLSTTRGQVSSKFIIK